MNKIIKNFLLLICSSFFILFLGCDDNSNSNKSQIEISGVVIGRSDLKFEIGDLKTYDISGNRRIIYTDKTRAIRQRGSCSGFDNANPNDIRLGDILIVKYYPSEVDWSTSPTVIRAISIDAYIAGCMSGEKIVDNNGCSICNLIN